MIVDVHDVKKLFEKTLPIPVNSDLRGQYLIRKPISLVPSLRL